METGLEYRGTDLNTLFAQRRNLVNPGFLRMLVEIVRFNREARRLLQSEDITTSLNDFLAAGHYSREFVERYVTPLGSSIWSSDPSRFGEFPAAAMARFFDRHGLLRLRHRPKWRTVKGGASRYVEALTAPMLDRIRLGAPVHRIARDETGVSIWAGDGTAGERFDRVIVAAHADEALAMLDAPTPLETETLGAFRFQPNRATLHTDVTMLPRNHRAWASWNYQRVAYGQHSPTITYNANSLQSLRSERVFCTTLNREEDIDPVDVIASFDYAHPVFDAKALQMQGRQSLLNGQEHTYYCGAYWGYGFHEDGVQSALRVTREFGADL
jgi:predicted NAD/FAD-binding protein